MNKEIKITPPKGYEIDKENSTFDCIKFKQISERWRDSIGRIEGYYISGNSALRSTEALGLVLNTPLNYNTFATKKQAKSSLAMARISQIMANDERFGGPISDEEWDNDDLCKCCIMRFDNTIIRQDFFKTYHLLAFHTREQRDLFLEENEDLVKDYLMLD